MEQSVLKITSQNQTDVVEKEPGTKEIMPKLKQIESKATEKRRKVWTV